MEHAFWDGTRRSVCGIRVERCQDSYLVPKNSELQAIVFFFSINYLLFFRCFSFDHIAIEFLYKRRNMMLFDKSDPHTSTTLQDVFHLSSALKTSGIMIRPHVSAQNILFHDICNFFFFFLMLHFEHIVIIWNNRW